MNQRQGGAQGPPPERITPAALGAPNVKWVIHGVPFINTNIASKVGPQLDPKDIDTLEFQPGGFSSEYGDRAYGVFNVATRSGFEGTHQGELAFDYGSHHSTDNQISLGSHSDRFAYFVSLNGNRTDLGLQTPASEVIHDQRITISSGFSVDLPQRSWFTGNVSHGSGFLNGDGPDHLSSHTSLDSAFGKSFGKKWAVKFSAWNVTIWSQMSLPVFPGSVIRQRT